MLSVQSLLLCMLDVHTGLLSSIFLFWARFAMALRMWGCPASTEHTTRILLLLRCVAYYVLEQECRSFMQAKKLEKNNGIIQTPQLSPALLAQFSVVQNSKGESACTCTDPWPLLIDFLNLYISGCILWCLVSFFIVFTLRHWLVRCYAVVIAALGAVGDMQMENEMGHYKKWVQSWVLNSAKYMRWRTCTAGLCSAAL